MTVSELIDSLNALCVPRETEVILRCEPEEDMGPCFMISGVCLQASHADGKVAVMLDGTQELEEELKVEMVNTPPQTIEVSSEFFAKLEKAQARLKRKRNRESNVKG